MDLVKHAGTLGRLVGNLQSLEFLLRLFLQKQPSARPLGMAPGKDVYSYPVGSWLPENDLTSYDSLGQLIDKYNAQPHVTQVDRSIVEVRDALAHGRVSGTDDSTQPLRLMKFSRPCAGRVRVEYNEELSPEWFSTEIRRVLDAVKGVVDSLRRLEGEAKSGNKTDT